MYDAQNCEDDQNRRPACKRHRARFAGLDKEGAEAACRALKRNDIACISLKN